MLSQNPLVWNIVLLGKKKKQGHSYRPWEGLYSSSLGGCLFIESEIDYVKQKVFKPEIFILTINLKSESTCLQPLLCWEKKKFITKFAGDGYLL